jgi:hypothetical protein
VQQPELAEPIAPVAVQRGRAGVVFGTTAVFYLLGPPIGVISYIAAMIIWDAGNGNFALKDALGIPLILVFAIPLSYIFGALPAIGVGIMVGLWQAFRGRLVWPAAAGIGLVAGAATAWFNLLDVADNGPSPLPVVLATCCAPTLICWYIMRNFTAARVEQNDQSTPAPR